MKIYKFYKFYPDQKKMGIPAGDPEKGKKVKMKNI